MRVLREPSSQQGRELRDAQFRQLLLDWYDAQRARFAVARRAEIRTAFGCRKSCCNRRAWRRYWSIIDEFLRRFPTVEKLGIGTGSSVLAAWSGLGYYRRARMLHAAAKVVARERREDSRKQQKNARELPGIGRYTAAAIASIAFGEPVAVVDGNVERVLRASFRSAAFAGEGVAMLPRADWIASVREISIRP